MSKLMLEDLKDYVWAATHHDYLLGILITSQAQAKITSEGWSFGAGKSTFGVSYFKQYVWGGDFNKVMEHLIGFPHELAPFLKPPTTPGVFCDDIQLWAGKHKAHDIDVRELAYFLTTQRPHINVIMATCPHRGMLQKDFREEIFHFEVIVPKRGVFEIQKLKRKIPFYNPLQIDERLRYFGEGPFLDLSPKEKQVYLEWREWRDEEAKKRIKLLENPLMNPSNNDGFEQIYENMKEQLPELKGLDGMVSAGKVMLKSGVGRKKANLLKDLLDEELVKQAKEKELPIELAKPKRRDQAIKMAISGIGFKKSVAQAFQFQGHRVTESYGKNEPDIVIWEDETTPAKVVAVKNVMGKGTLNIEDECKKEIEFARKHGLAGIHLIAYEGNKKLFDSKVDYNTTTVEIQRQEEPNGSES